MGLCPFHSQARASGSGCWCRTGWHRAACTAGSDPGGRYRSDSRWHLSHSRRDTTRTSSLDTRAGCRRRLDSHIRPACSHWRSSHRSGIRLRFAQCRRHTGTSDSPAAEGYRYRSDSRSRPARSRTDSRLRTQGRRPRSRQCHLRLALKRRPPHRRRHCNIPWCHLVQSCRLTPPRRQRLRTRRYPVSRLRRTCPWSRSGLQRRPLTRWSRPDLRGWPQRRAHRHLCCQTEGRCRHIPS